MNSLRESMGFAKQALRAIDGDENGDQGELGRRFDAPGSEALIGRLLTMFLFHRDGFHVLALGHMVSLLDLAGLCSGDQLVRQLPFHCNRRHPKVRITAAK